MEATHFSCMYFSCDEFFISVFQEINNYIIWLFFFCFLRLWFYLKCFYIKCVLIYYYWLLVYYYNWLLIKCIFLGYILILFFVIYFGLMCCIFLLAIVLCVLMLHWYLIFALINILFFIFLNHSNCMFLKEIFFTVESVLLCW